MICLNVKTGCFDQSTGLVPVWWAQDNLSVVYSSIWLIAGLIAALDNFYRLFIEWAWSETPSGFDMANFRGLPLFHLIFEVKLGIIFVLCYGGFTKPVFMRYDDFIGCWITVWNHLSYLTWNCGDTLPISIFNTSIILLLYRGEESRYIPDLV